MRWDLFYLNGVDNDGVRLVGVRVGKGGLKISIFLVIKFVGYKDK